MAPWTIACQAPLSSTISQSLLKLMSIELVMLANHPILCCSLHLSPSIFFIIKVLYNKSALRMGWPTLKHRLVDEYSGLISFRIDWFGLLAVQGTLNSLHQDQFESIKSSALSLLYGPTFTSIHVTGKAIAFSAF